MARSSRQDRAGAWHHVINRGIARRPLFETKADIRFFLACLARAARRGQLEIHAWCVLTTHFHLLVRSPLGELSAALRRVQNAYVRHFNRGRRRDGPLVRGRFLSKPVDSLAYRTLLVRYIDANPVRAGLATAAWEYPWCSAHAYAHRQGPPWLTRTWVESLACERLRCARFDGAMYADAFPTAVGEVLARLIEHRVQGTARGDAGQDPLDDLLAAAPERIQEWMRRKSLMADGTVPGSPVLDPLSIQQCVEACRRQDPTWTLRLGRRVRQGWDLIEVGLLREWSGASLTMIAQKVALHPVAVGRLYEEHRCLLEGDSKYRASVTHCLQHVSLLLRQWTGIRPPSCP